jgi:hypothetical protein
VYAPPPAYAPAPGYGAPQGYQPPPVYAAPQPYTAPPSFGVAAATASSAAGTDDVSEFVSKITQSTRFDRSAVARWRAPICFSVTGLPQNEDAFVVQRLTQIARDAGARIESKGCTKGSYNFHVVFTLDAAGTASDWYNHHRGLFEENAAGPAQIDRFLEPSTPPPVRVWHDATLFGTDGEPLVAVDPGNPVESMPQTDMTGSRLRPQGALGLNYALIIVDGKRTNGAGLAAIADYVAMAGLVDLNLAAELGDDATILRLFSAPANQRPGGLTSLDRAFLSAAYHSEQDPRNLRADISGAMTQRVAP